MLAASEVAEEYEVSDLDVLTESGWKPVKKVYKTVPLPVWRISAGGFVLECSKHHLVVTGAVTGRVSALSEAGDVLPGTQVMTERGLQVVDESCDTGRVEELYDIEVDSKSHLFFSGGILSHNSTTLAARIIMSMLMIPRYKVLYLTPYTQQAATFADRFREMESLCRVRLGKQNKKSKHYPNGSLLRIEHALTDSQHIRGGSFDLLAIDEIQNMDPDLLPEIFYTQTNSSLPTRLFTGTALTIDTYLEACWQGSSMATWMVRDGNGKYLNMYDADTLMKVCDNPRGPTCPTTGKLLDVTDGHFEHSNLQALAIGNIGYHVPQCIIPDIAYNPAKWMELYRHLKNDPMPKIMQECFGIAIAEGTREITQQDLLRLCVLADSKEELKEKCATGYYRVVISGCDWGGSDYNPATRSKLSYTVHCIIGIAPDDRVDILHYRRYSGMDYRDIAANIVDEHYAFNGDVIASDFGVGMAYNMEIRKSIPFDKHFVMTYASPNSAPMQETKGSHMANQLSINKTEAITNVFRDVRDPIGKIRCRSWVEVGDYLQDWLNVYRELSETKLGTKTFVYRRAATKADDALHAFVFAYTLALYFMGVPLVQDIVLEQKLRHAMTGGNVPPIDLDGAMYVVSG